MSGGVLKRLWPARLALLGILAAAAGQGGAEPSPGARPLPPAMPASYYGLEEADRDEGLMRDVVLGMHNEERESLGLSPLAWDSALAADAARYARQMAQPNIFLHSAPIGRAAGRERVCLSV